MKQLVKTSNLELRYWHDHWQLYALILLPFLYIVVFKYIPMAGVIVAFKKYSFSKGIINSPWVGFHYFEKFFRSAYFKRVISNTLEISIYSLVVEFPFPVLLALMLNSCRTKALKKTVQLVTYVPYFISSVVMVGIIKQMLSPRLGVINRIIEMCTGDKLSFLSFPGLFSSIYVWTNVWQFCGWNSIVYLAALASIDPCLHEAAKIDGAGRFRRIMHIDIPGIVPTMLILLILRVGQLMSVGFEKVFLLQNSLNISRSEVINTLVYKVGLSSAMPQFSYAAAIGLFNGVINLICILAANKIIKKITGSALW